MRLPSLKPKEVIAALKKVGFAQARQSGSHLILINQTKKKITIAPLHAKEIKRGLLMAIIKQSGLTQEQFRRLLQKIK